MNITHKNVLTTATLTVAPLTIALLTIALLTIAPLTMLAGVNILPMSPKAGEQITIEYTPLDADKAWAEEADNLHAVLFAFTQEAESPVATEIPLTKRGTRWTAAYRPAGDVVFGMIKVGDGLRYDNNKELYWNVMMFESGNRPVRHAHMKAAMAALGLLPAECRRKQDLQEAENELEEETKFHPNNLAAQVNLIMISVNLQTIDQQEAQVRLTQLVEGKTTADNVMDAIALAQAYQVLQQPDMAMRIMNDASISFPGSKIEEQSKLEALGKAASLAEFVNGVSMHLRNYPNTFAKQNLIEGAITATTRASDLRLLIEFIDNTPGLTAMTHYVAVNYVGTQDSLRPDAYRMIEKGLAASDNDKLRPSFVCPTEWKQQQRISKSLLHFVKGAILSNDPGHEADGIKELSMAIEIGGAQTDKAAHDMYVTTLVKAGRSGDAMNAATVAIKSGAATQNVLDTYRSLSKADGKDSVATEKQLKKLRTEGSKVLVERLSREMLNQGAVEGTFYSVDGKPLNISDWKGKVVILDYWATWCGPCRKSFPSMQKLYEKYRNNPEVVFAIVNVWEKSEDKVKTVTDFLSENKTLTFPVYIDKDDSVVAKFGVTGIPTKFFLGKDGRIQFKEVGYLPEEQFIEESSNRIEVLLSK